MMLALAFVLVAIVGYWLAGMTVAPEDAKDGGRKEESGSPRWTVVEDEAAPKFRNGERVKRSGFDLDALEAGALAGQRVLTFSDQAALEDFLSRMGNGVRLLGRLDALNALRVGFGDYGDLLSMLDGDEEESFIFPVNAPPPVDGSVQPGAIALGNGLLEWLGITVDNSTWGSGVTIAVLDTGVASHPAFGSSISSINLVDLPFDPTLQNGHGTAVASVIIGNNSRTPGVAPGADILSIRIADDNGQSDSYVLAQGIIAAVDAGANPINISMGSTGDSGLIRNAIEYAAQRGVLIVAATGNNGSDQVSYPAANEGVIAVGAVDALGRHLDFSNSGETVSIAAPGYGVNAAWVGDEVASVTGTSFSAPIVVGAIAAIMTESGPSNLSARQAYDLLTDYLNDGGAAGTDFELGGGMPDIGRALNAGKRGINDAALASLGIVPGSSANPFGQVEALVQNRGTEMLINVAVEVATGSGKVVSNLTSLGPNEVRVVRVPLNRAPSKNSNELRVEARVSVSGGVVDVKTSNNRRVESYEGAN